MTTATIIVLLLGVISIISTLGWIYSNYNYNELKDKYTQLEIDGIRKKYETTTMDRIPPELLD